MKSILSEVVDCFECGWRGTVKDCIPDVNGWGNLGCPDCNKIVYGFDSQTIDTLAKDIHGVWCHHFSHAQEKDYWTKGDFDILPEETKEIDRAFARWILTYYFKNVPIEYGETGMHFQIHDGFDLVFVKVNKYGDLEVSKNPSEEYLQLDAIRAKYLYEQLKRVFEDGD